MKVEVMRLVEVDVMYVHICAPVRYDEEDIPNDFPLRKGDMWEATVEIETGQILDWPMQAEPRELYMKVCDEGIYRLQDKQFEEVASIELDYVPHGLIPGQYGDYIGLEISPEGVITNWPSEPDVQAFFPDANA